MGKQKRSKTMKKLLKDIQNLAKSRKIPNHHKIGRILNLIRIHRDGLTREYFADHKWKIEYQEIENGEFVIWVAKWERSIETGSPYWANLSVTNMMYEDRFCVSGNTSNGYVNIMVYTEENLNSILKALNIYDYYKVESKPTKTK